MKQSQHDITRQIEIIHLSDIHFGNTHRFKIPNSADGDTPMDDGYPTLAEKLKEDLIELPNDCPVLICMTGDFVDTANVEEYNQAEKFISDLLDKSALSNISRKNIFIIPGNHDVNYASENLGLRFQQYIEFYNRFYGTAIKREEPQSCQMVFDRSSEGFIAVRLNSFSYVKKGTQDEKRGRIDIRDLERLKKELEYIPKEKLQNSIRFALIHHHPVLIPSLAEPDRGYDAVYNSEKLISILEEYGFHAILHGHKHDPHTFTEDIKPAYQATTTNPLLVVAGGSVGSKELPSNPRCLNSYNKIKIKWHPKGEQARIRVETRGLKLFNENGVPLIPTRWYWELMNVDDHHFYPKNNLPSITKNQVNRKFSKKDKTDDKSRINIYSSSRGNLPVIDVLPSLDCDQAYEAIIWIVQHPYQQEKKGKDIPVKVIYSAGENFDIIEVTKEQSVHYTAKINYWGPMLIKVKIIFTDNHEFSTFIYARMPNQY